jgi:hypothetical protein
MYVHCLAGPLIQYYLICKRVSVFCYVSPLRALVLNTVHRSRFSMYSRSYTWIVGARLAIAER